MKAFVIDARLAQAVLDYLVTKPYSEVAALVAQLAQLPPVKELEAKTEKDLASESK